jgi:antitoxin ParD1/3/4
VKDERHALAAVRPQAHTLMAKIAKRAFMATMNISLTDPLKQFVDEEVSEGGYSSTSDYVRDLIRQRQRRKAEDLLRQLIADGLASGPAAALEPGHFQQMRKRARARAGK